MGKNKKKDPGKKAALQAKKDAKADKAARKRAKKDSNKASDEAQDNDDNQQQSLDDLLQVYRKRDIEGSKPIVETLEGFPPPRGNFSMTVVEDQKGKQQVYVFGGEYFDGVENIVVDHLLRWTYTSKNNKEDHEWKQIVMPSAAPSPPARCAHSTVYYNGGLYVFGGELASPDHYHHYKDLWRYDVKQQSWTELNCKTGSVPSARSGHAAIVWKHYMVVFGGFYEAMKDTPRWFNDMYVFDLKTQQWMDVPYSKLGNRPEPRSACNIAVVSDNDVVVQGGFSKLTAASAGKETKVHTDAWLLHLKPILQGKPPTWEKLLSSSTVSSAAETLLIANNNTPQKNPNGRCAAASASYKNKMLVFGGVIDAELMHHKVDSVFFNDLFCLDVDPKPRWFPLKVRKQQKAADAQQQQHQEIPAAIIQEEKDDEEEDDDDNMDLDMDEDDGNDDNPQPTGWNIDQLRENMFAFVDGSGNIVYERFDKDNNNKKVVSDDEEKEEEEEEETKEEEKEEDSDEEEKPAAKRPSKKNAGGPAVGRATTITSSSVMRLDPETKTPEAMPRDEPLPRIKCGAIINRNTLFIYGGLVEIGDREVTLDDMWSLDLRKRNQWNCLWPGTMHKQVWRGAVHDDDDSYISTGGDGDDDDEDDSEDEEEEKSGSVAGQSEELANLTAEHDLGNPLRTPQDGEALADFYARTKSNWNDEALEALKQAGETEEPSKKQLKREGFQLAQKRYTDLEPVLARLKELGLEPGKQKKSKKKK